MRRGAGRLAGAARWSLTLGLVALLLTVVDLREVYRLLLSADPALLAVAVAVSVGDRLLMAGKWLPLLRLQVPDVSAARAMRAYFASSFAAVFLPASIGADLLRAVGIGRERETVLKVGASIVVERALGAVGAGVVALLALWVAFRAEVSMAFLVPWALACAAAGVAATAIPFSAVARRTVRRLLAPLRGRGWVEVLGRFGTAYGLYGGHPRTLVVVGLLSALEQLVPVLVLGAAARAMQLGLSLESLVVAVPLTFFAARLPISVAGIGIVEGGLVYLLGLFGVPPAEALSLALAGRVVELVAVLPGAFWWRELAGRAASPAVPAATEAEELPPSVR